MSDDPTSDLTDADVVYLTIRFVVHGALGMLFAMSAAGQEPIESNQPMASVNGAPLEPTLIRIVPYTDEMHMLPSDAPPSCYRIGRCSAYDIYRFRDRPNRLTRLAPEAPPEIGARPPSIRYVWFHVSVTPEENILPKYRTTSQVRDEYRSAGTPLDGP